MHTKYLLEKCKWKSSLRNPRCRSDDTIKTSLTQIGYDCAEWINLAQDRDQWQALVKTVTDLQVL
jgi:hypothetical protein